MASVNVNIDELPFIPGSMSNSRATASLRNNSSSSSHERVGSEFEMSSSSLVLDNNAININNDYSDEFNRSKNSAKIYLGCILVDPYLVKSAWTDFLRVVLPSLVTKTVGRLLWLGHIISPNILSLAFLASNAAVGCLISCISATLEFGIRMFELYQNKSDKSFSEKVDSSLRIALKTAVKFFCVYMSWVLGTFAMTAFGIMSGPYLALGILGVGAATAMGLAFATVLTEVLPILWKEKYQQYTVAFMKHCKIDVKHKKIVDNFFKTCLLDDNKLGEQDLVNKIKENNELKSILEKQGFDVNNDLDEEEIKLALKNKGKLDFSPVKGAILRGGLEGICWSYLESILNEKHLDSKIDAAIVSGVVSSSFLIGGCIDYIFRIKYFQTRNQKILKNQIQNINSRLLDSITKDINSQELKPSEILQIYRICNRIKNVEFKNKVLKWVKQVIAYKNSDSEFQDSNPQSPTNIEEVSSDQNISWKDLESIIYKPRVLWSLGFFCCKTKTSRMARSPVNVQFQSIVETKSNILKILGNEGLGLIHWEDNNISSDSRDLSDAISRSNSVVSL